MKALGVETGTGDLFRALAQTVPGWVVPMGEGGPGLPAYEAGAIGAMRRIITEADDPVEASQRFHEMVRAGVDRFNEGSLPQAVQMLELAERLVSEKKVDAGSAEIARRRLGDSLDWEKLKAFAEQAGDQAQLRKVLQFFTALQVEGLLETLPGELQARPPPAHAPAARGPWRPARQGSFERLTRSLGPQVGEEEWFFRRNLLYLLRRIPRGAESGPLDAEIDVVLQHAQLGLPLVVIKEAVAALGPAQGRKDRGGTGPDDGRRRGAPVEAAGEAGLRGQGSAGASRPGGLDARAPARRGRRGGPHRARRQEAGLARRHDGAAFGALAQSLADDAETVEQLLGMVKANLPLKVLGVVIRQNDQNLVRLVEALSGTPTPAVRRALAGARRAVPGQGGGAGGRPGDRRWDKPAAPAEGPRAAAPGVAGAAADAPAASLQGDLEVFGLPSLLQSLADSSASGSLTLREPKGGPVFASLTLRDGKLELIKRGKLSGDDAFYQLLERPSPGQFAFVKGAPPASPGASQRAILPLTLEAMRRYDELQEASALVPDTVFLVSTGQAPTTHPGEKDGGFLRALWQRASQGGTPEDFEEAVAADSYRIRRLLAHWVEQGSLKVRAKA